MERWRRIPFCVNWTHDRFAGNAASQRVLEKIGMRHEGRSRQHVKKLNRWIDLENYGILAEEFRKGEPARGSDALRKGEPARRSQDSGEGG
jgi:hypothetical protein